MNRLQKQAFSFYLNEFKAISVRETSLKKALEEYTSKKIEVLPDPVFLLSKEQWKDLFCTSSQNICNGKYLFCYYLGNNKIQKQAAESLAKKLQLKLVTVPFIGSHVNDLSDIQFGDVSLPDVGPREFLELIYHAEAVLTDSFHAMAFSVIFEKKFIVTERYGKKDVGYSNSRISNFLSEYGLESRLCREMNELERIFECSVDYAKAEMILHKKRKYAKDWLDHAISQ